MARKVFLIVLMHLLKVFEYNNNNNTNSNNNISSNKKQVIKITSKFFNLHITYFNLSNLLTIYLFIISKKHKKN